MRVSSTLIALFPPTCRENPPACPVCRGVFASVLLTVVGILCEGAPSCRFSCFTFLVPAKEKSRTLPCALGEDFHVLKDNTSFWVNCKNCQEAFKVCLYSCLLYLFRLVSTFRCLALKTRVYSSSFLSKHWKFRSSRPDKTSGSSGLAWCLWQ